MWEGGAELSREVLNTMYANTLLIVQRRTLFANVKITCVCACLYVFMYIYQLLIIIWTFTYSN